MLVVELVVGEEELLSQIFMRLFKNNFLHNLISCSVHTPNPLNDASHAKYNASHLIPAVGYDLTDLTSHCLVPNELIPPNQVH
jgi:hypothetical protein